MWLSSFETKQLRQEEKIRNQEFNQKHTLFLFLYLLYEPMNIIVVNWFRFSFLFSPLLKLDSP